MFPGRGRPVRKIALLVSAVATVVLVASCSLIPSSWFGPSDNQLVRDKMAHIIEAVNDQDAAALRAMFTDYALAEYSAEIDVGVARLLALFPNGDVIWRDGGGSQGSGGGLVGDGKKTWLGGMWDVISSAGKEYTLRFSIFTENSFDPENVGLFRISVDPLTENHDSGAELASCEPVEDTDARAGGPPGVFIGDSGGLTRDRAAQIVAAINAQDAATLNGMFTDYARTKYATQVDEGVEHLLSKFPRGDVVLHENTGGSAVCERIEGDARTVLLPTFYTVDSGGVDYRLYFADFIENTIDPENVGIYAMGAELVDESCSCGPVWDLVTWGRDFDLEATVRPGVFVSSTHKADLRMEQIAAALNTHDSAALKEMFSADVLEQTPQLDEQLDYLLSLFPSGEVTWVQDPAEVNPIYALSNVEAGYLAEWLEGHYKLSADGNEYWLYFEGATINELNPGRVGLNQLGVTPWVEERSTDGMTGPSASLYSWIHGNNDPGIYVPD